MCADGDELMSRSRCGSHREPSVAILSVECQGQAAYSGGWASASGSESKSRSRTRVMTLPILLRGETAQRCILSCPPIIPSVKKVPPPCPKLVYHFTPKSLSWQAPHRKTKSAALRSSNRTYSSWYGETSPTSLRSAASPFRGGIFRNSQFVYTGKY